MIFDEVFLQSQNDDCLGQVLSFLTCQDLSNVARTCKVLKHTIFETDHEESNVNLIWQGAEEALTLPWDLEQELTSMKKRARVGANAREHCHLFAVASKAAKACELLDGIEENRIMVDGFLADLINVRGFDAESIVEKKALAAANTQTLEEASADIVFKRLSDEEFREAAQRARESELERTEKWEKLSQLPAPTKTYHHSIFVRISLAETGEMISEGFCGSRQSIPWYAGLELAHEYHEDMIDAIMKKICAQGPGINVTAVVIDRRNYDIQCLFQHDQTQATGWRMIGPGFGFFDNFTKCNFGRMPRWGSDSIQLGPSISHDLYYLSFSLSYNVATKKVDGCPVLLPLLEVTVLQDRSAFHLALQNKYTRARHDS